MLFLPVGPTGGPGDGGLTGGVVGPTVGPGDGGLVGGVPGGPTVGPSPSTVTVISSMAMSPSMPNPPLAGPLVAENTTLVTRGPSIKGPESSH